MSINRFHNVTNPYQGSRTKTLCVCSAGLLRSPTLAFILSKPPYNRNTRAVGHSQEYALIPIDAALVHWADEIVFVDEESYSSVLKNGFDVSKKRVVTLSVPDVYDAFSEELIIKINSQLVDAGFNYECK